MTSTQDERQDVTSIPSIEEKEPALKTGGKVGIGTLIVDGFALFVAPITVDQKLYLISLVTVLAPIVAGALIRFKVYGPRTVEQIRTYYEVALREKDHQIVEARATQNVARAIEHTLQRMQGVRQPPAPTLQQPARAPSTPQRPASPPPASQAPALSWLPSASAERPGQQVPDLPAGFARTAEPAGDYVYTKDELGFDAGPGLPEGFTRHRRAEE